MSSSSDEEDVPTSNRIKWLETSDSETVESDEDYEPSSLELSSESEHEIQGKGPRDKIGQVQQTNRDTISNTDNQKSSSLLKQKRKRRNPPEFLRPFKKTQLETPHLEAIASTSALAYPIPVYNDAGVAIGETVISNGVETYRCLKDVGENVKCGRQFVNENALKMHYYHPTSHTTKKNCVCSQCGKVLSCNYSRKIHEERVHMKMPRRAVECQNCGKPFASQQLLKRHLGRKMRLGECPSKSRGSAVKEEGTNIIVYPCSRCDVPFPSVQERHIHLLTCTVKPKPYGKRLPPVKERMQQTKFNTPKDLSETEDVAKPLVGSKVCNLAGLAIGVRCIENGIEKFQCTWTSKDNKICGKKFDSWPGLTTHYGHRCGHNGNLAAGVDNRACKFCFKSFSRPMAREKHEQICKGSAASGSSTSALPKKKNQNPVVQCKFCETYFAGALVLKIHEKNRKNGECPVDKCKAKRYNPETKRLEYPCGGCNLVFDDIVLYRRHNNTCQTTCEFCKRKFSRKQQLKKHLWERETYDPMTCHNVRKIKNDQLYCEICDRYFSRSAYDPHCYSHQLDENYSRPAARVRDYIDNNGIAKYKCSECTFFTGRARGIEKHELNVHKTFKSLENLTNNQMSIKDPLSRYKLGEETPLNFNDLDLEEHVNWRYKWIRQYSDQKLQLTIQRKSGIYCAVALSEDFKSFPSNNIKEFIRTNPGKVAIYWGSDAAGSKHKISERHIDHPESSPLAQRAAKGATIVALVRENYKGTTLEEKQELSKLAEAKKIELICTKYEYKSASGQNECEVINQTREAYAMRNISDEELRLLFAKALSNSDYICTKENCPGCNAAICPDWNQVTIVDMSSAIGRLKNQKLPVLPSLLSTREFKKKRLPTSKEGINAEIKKRIQNFRQLANAHDPRHYVYTVITPRLEDFPTSNQAVTICQDIVKRKDEDLEIGIYCGVNSLPCAAEYHYSIPQRSSISSERLDGKKNALTIQLQEFGDRKQARIKEAVTLLFYLLLQKFKRPGIQFSALNRNMEWSYLTMATEVETKDAIRQAICGVSPISMEKDATKDQSLQINLLKRLKDKYIPRD